MLAWCHNHFPSSMLPIHFMLLYCNVAVLIYYKWILESVQIIESRCITSHYITCSVLICAQICRWVYEFYYFNVFQNWKFDTLCDLYETLTITQAVIFVNTRRKVDFLYSEMQGKDFTVSAMVRKCGLEVYLFPQIFKINNFIFHTMKPCIIWGFSFNKWRYSQISLIRIPSGLKFGVHNSKSP